MILIELVKHSQSCQNSNFQMSLQYLKKKVTDHFEFLHQVNNEVDFNTLGVKVSYKAILLLLMGMIKDSQSNKFAISLQYLKEEVRKGVHFLHGNKH